MEQLAHLLSVTCYLVDCNLVLLDQLKLCNHTAINFYYHSHHLSWMSTSLECLQETRRLVFPVLALCGHCCLQWPSPELSGHLVQFSVSLALSLYMLLFRSVQLLMDCSNPVVTSFFPPPYCLPKLRLDWMLRFVILHWSFCDIHTYSQEMISQVYKIWDLWW